MDLLKWIEIDRSAIRHNLRWVRSRLARGVRLMAVVKADAYGHGAAEVGRLAMRAGANCLGVLTFDEAVALRRAGLRGPIVVLSPILPSQAPAAIRERLELTVDSERLLDAAQRSGRGVMVHVDLDFGLGRWGIEPDRLPAFLRAVERRKGLRLAGISTHFDYVPGKNAVEAELKLREFHGLCKVAKSRFPGAVCHAANSSVLLDFPHRQMDMVRIGNFLYGINPTKTPAELKSPWAFYARIISLRRVSKGQSIGYASAYIAPTAMTVATLPVGYADGLTMQPLSRLIGLGRRYRYWGMLGGHQTPFVGGASIAHVLVDVSRVPSARVGDAIALPIRRTAASQRIPRVYVR